MYFKHYAYANDMQRRPKRQDVNSFIENNYNKQEVLVVQFCRVIIDWKTHSIRVIYKTSNLCFIHDMVGRSALTPIQTNSLVPFSTKCQNSIVKLIHL